jgi:ubiquinol-cytochrome c reductase iron-sulfur subunit
MGKAKDALLASLLLLARKRKRRLWPGQRERHVPPAPPNPGSEVLAGLLLLAAAACGVAFVVVYALDRLPAHTQLLGLSLGLACLFIAAALIVTAKRLIVTEELEDDYPVEEHVDEQETVVQIVADSGFSRRRFLKLGLLAAGGALTAAALTPVASLGPVIHMARFYATPWRRGRRLVDERGKPYRASDIEENTLYTAFAEGSEKEEMGSSLVLVRLPTDQLELPSGQAGFDADGIVAYSKVCTHAGCAISLYRSPHVFPEDEPSPALVCPCHYSTFDPARGGKVTFGPAGRKLPMLPLMTGPGGELRAKGNFDSPVGPSWWGVRLKRPTS